MLDRWLFFRNRWLLLLLSLLLAAPALAEYPDWASVADVKVIEVVTRDADGDLRERLKMAGVRPLSVWREVFIYHQWHPQLPRGEGNAERAKRASAAKAKPYADEWDADLVALYASVADPVSGRVDNIIQIHSLDSAAMAGHQAVYEAAMGSTKTLRKVERELIALVVSDINGCHY